MKKISTYYFILLAGVNAWLTWFFPIFTGMMDHQWKEDLGGAEVPWATQVFLHAPWWPAVFFAIFLMGTVVSVFVKRQNQMLLHVVILTLMVEGFVLFWAVVSYSIPYLRIISPLK